MHEARIKHRHYVTTATAETHWYNFYAEKLKNYQNLYGEDFCLVINCSTTHDSAYVLPFAAVKQYLSPAYLNGSRWIGAVHKDNVVISGEGQPVQEVWAGDYHNAFELLQDAPTPLPPQVRYA